MHKIVLTMILSLMLVACDQQGKSNTAQQSAQDYDNTAKNVRDRDAVVNTPLDQPESELDRKITQKIRQTLLSDDSLSTNGKNIKIVTINGVVTLRGAVLSSKERDLISKKVADIQGVVKVDNQLNIND